MQKADGVYSICNAGLGRGFDHDCLEFGIECLDEIQEAAAGGHSSQPREFRLSESVFVLLHAGCRWEHGAGP
jgi:hypothetical protein